MEILEEMGDFKDSSDDKVELDRSPLVGSLVRVVLIAQKLKQYIPKPYFLKTYTHTKGTLRLYVSSFPAPVMLAGQDMKDIRGNGKTVVF